MNFNKAFSKKESFHHVVLNNWKNSPWRELITCGQVIFH